MTVNCTTIDVLLPAIITATSIVPDKTTCTAPCDVSVDVTWTNSGDIEGTFTPSLMIDGTPITPAPYPPENLAPGASITHIFAVSGLTAGSHQICADPNTFPCATVTVLTPAFIVATSIVPDKTTCIEPCDVSVDVTWTNSGQTADTFAPTILVDGTPISLAPEVLGPTQTVTRTFAVTGLTKGSHTICASPIDSTVCTTITVEQVMQAGFGIAGMVLMAGLAIGAMYAARKKHGTYRYSSPSR